MSTTWFQKDSGPEAHRPLRGRSVTGSHTRAERTAGHVARMKPQDLIMLLMSHYTRLRNRSQPRVKISLAVSAPQGGQAVMISFGDR